MLAADFISCLGPRSVAFRHLETQTTVTTRTADAFLSYFYSLANPLLALSESQYIPVLDKYRIMIVKCELRRQQYVTPGKERMTDQRSMTAERLWQEITTQLRLPAHPILPCFARTLTS